MQDTSSTAIKRSLTDIVIMEDAPGVIIKPKLTNIVIDEIPEEKPQKTYSIGTLKYTKAGLVIMFCWLLWGDFMFQLMEMVEPRILPVLLKNHGATNQEIMFIAGSIMLALNTVMNPFISYNSDRTRTRWGRRRPYIIFTTPFVVLFLALTPFAPEILEFLNKSINFSSLLSWSPVSPIIVLFGLLVVMYQIFNLFVASVYYYLIRDVVPTEFIGRFRSLFAIVATISGLFFNYFIFGFSETHYKEIFVGIAILYGIAIIVMCWKVKEGEYPPPSVEKHDKWWSGIINFIVESYGKMHYWWIFLTYSCIVAAGCSGMLAVFMFKDEFGYSMDQYGKLCAYTGVLSVALMYFGGILIDRWGSHKSLMLGLGSSAIIQFTSYFFMTDYWSVFWWAMVQAVPNAVMGVAFSKLVIDMFPQERFGQFSSAQALISSSVGVIMNFTVGYVADWLGSIKFIILWTGFFRAAAFVLLIVVFIKWIKLGGKKSYVAP